MVLSFILILLHLNLPDSTLLQKYEKQVHKVLEKEFSSEGLEFESLAFSRGELYVIKKAKKTKGYILVAEVAACRLGGCSAFEKINDNSSAEYFDMMLLCDEDKNIITISILDYFSEYGYEITSKKYLKKFKDKNVCSFSSDTDGIDAVSGATVSSYAMEAMIASLCESL
jgi:hypothetical protein